jgi:hypothetical protein
VGTSAKAGRNHVDATRTQPQDGKAVDARALASQGRKLSSSDGDSGVSDSDPDPSSGDDGCSSEDEQSRWLDLDEQRLLAYEKEGKSWEWIFRKFPGRTRPAIPTFPRRWTSSSSTTVCLIDPWHLPGRMSEMDLISVCQSRLAFSSFTILVAKVIIQLLHIAGK